MVDVTDPCVLVVLMTTHVVCDSGREELDQSWYCELPLAVDSGTLFEATRVVELGLKIELPLNEEACGTLDMDELTPIACDFVCVRGHHVTYSVITPSTVLVAVET